MDGPSAAILVIDGSIIAVENIVQLVDGLRFLPTAVERAMVELRRTPKSYIRATRHGCLWAVTTRSGGWWTIGSFDPTMSTDHSAREVRESRAARSVIRWIFRSPPDERAISDRQVETLFVEYFLGRRFSLPFSGA